MIEFAFVLVMWLVIMVGMMAPSAAGLALLREFGPCGMQLSGALGRAKASSYRQMQEHHGLAGVAIGVGGPRRRHDAALLLQPGLPIAFFVLRTLVTGALLPEGRRRKAQSMVSTTRWPSPPATTDAS